MEHEVLILEEMLCFPPHPNLLRLVGVVPPTGKRAGAGGWKWRARAPVVELVRPPPPPFISNPILYKPVVRNLGGNNKLIS
jgi:hypothetical protein